MAAVRSVFLHSPALEAYHYPPECPFSSQRAGKTFAILQSMGLDSGPDRRVHEPHPAERSQLETYHTPHYLDTLRAAQDGEMTAEGLHMGLGTPDCPVFRGMYDYAALACGATLDGAKLIAQGDIETAFNPSGGYHHAWPDRAAGFCYINDVAIACGDLARRGMRVMYVDVDAHHGDGVQGAFYERADVLTVSFHESGRTLFPGTGFEAEIGRGEGEGYAVNVPLPVGTYDGAFMKAFREVALPLAGAFEPDVIVVELGMDGLAGDPLAHLGLTNNVYADLIGQLKAAGKPLLAVGGGGYHIENTTRAWALCWAALCGDSQGDDMMLGLGGVMMESTDWLGGLRDRVLVPDVQEAERVDQAVAATIEAVAAAIFPHHGLQTS